MWKTIEVMPTCRLRGLNSYIFEAENAIIAHDQTTIWLDRVEFKNNRIAFNIPIAGTPVNNVATNILNCNFHSVPPMPKPYPGQTTLIGTKGFTAFHINNANLTLTSGVNWIRDLSNGIMAYQSNLTLSGFVIRDIQPISTYTYVANGSGVYCRGDLGSYLLKQSGFGPNAGYSFQDCRWGIYTEYMNVKSSENNMYNAGTAYRIDRSTTRKVEVFNNRLLTHYNGIDLRMNHGAAKLYVLDNTISHGNITGNSKGYSAIYSAEGNISNPDTKILRNIIQFLPLSASRFGININSCDEYLIAENEAYMVNNSFNNFGIRLTGCRLTEVSCNYVLSTDNTFPNPSQAAIRNVMGSDPLISCNDVDKTANGIIVSLGPAYGTIVRGNKLRYHMWGLHLDPNAIIGQQPPPGEIILRSNLWYQAPAPGGYGAWYEDATNAANYPILYNPTLIAGGNTQPPSWLPSIWFQPSNGSNYICESDIENYCSQFDVRSMGLVSDLDERIATDSLENDPYTGESKWIMERELYYKLYQYPNLRDSLLVLDDFFNEVHSTVKAQLRILDADASNIHGLDSMYINTIDLNMDLIEGNLILIEQVQEALADTVSLTIQDQ